MSFSVPTVLLVFLLRWTWGISSWLLIKVQRLLLTMDVGCLLMAAATDLGHRVSPLGCSPLPVDGQLRAKAGFKLQGSSSAASSVDYCETQLPESVS